jgi:hypothetical protein
MKKIVMLALLALALPATVRAGGWMRVPDPCVHELRYEAKNRGVDVVIHGFPVPEATIERIADRPDFEDRVDGVWATLVSKLSEEDQTTELRLLFTGTSDLPVGSPWEKRNPLDAEWFAEDARASARWSVCQMLLEK